MKVKGKARRKGERVYVLVRIENQVYDQGVLTGEEGQLSVPSVCDSE